MLTSDAFNEAQCLVRELSFNEARLRRLLTTVWEERRSSSVAASIAGLAPPDEARETDSLHTSPRSKSPRSPSPRTCVRFGDGFASVSLALRTHALSTFKRSQQQSPENVWKAFGKWRTVAIESTTNNVLKVSIETVGLTVIQSLLTLLEEDYMVALICFEDIEMSFNAVKDLHLKHLLASAKELLDSLEMPQLCCLWANFNLLDVKLCQNAFIGVETLHDWRYRTNISFRFRQAFGRYALSVQCWLDVTVVEMERALEDGRWSNVLVSYRGKAVPVLKKLLPFSSVAQLLVIFWHTNDMHERIKGIRENIKRISDIFAKAVDEFPKKITWQKLELLIATAGYCRSEIENRMTEVNLPLSVIKDIVRPFDSLHASTITLIVNYAHFVTSSYLMRDVDSCDYGSGRPFWQNAQLSYCVRSWYHFVGRFRKFLWNAPHLPVSLRQEGFASVVAESLKSAVINYSQYKVSLARMEQFRCDVLYLLYGAADYLPYCVGHASDFTDSGSGNLWSVLDQIQSCMKQLTAILAIVTSPIVHLHRLVTKDNMPAININSENGIQNPVAGLNFSFNVESSQRFSDLSTPSSSSGLEFELRLFECQLESPFELLLEVGVCCYLSALYLSHVAYTLQFLILLLYLNQHIVCGLFLRRLWNMKSDEQARNVFTSLVWLMIYSEWDNLSLARMLKSLSQTISSRVTVHSEEEWLQIKESTWYCAIEQSLNPLILNEFRAFAVSNPEVSFSDPVYILKLFRRIVSSMPAPLFGLETFLVDMFGESFALAAFIIRLIWNQYISWVKPALEWDWRQESLREQMDNLFAEMMSMASPDQERRGKRATEYYKEINQLCDLILEKQKHALSKAFDLEKLPYSVAKVASEHNVQILSTEQNGKQKMKLLWDFVRSNSAWLRKQLSFDEPTDLKMLSMDTLKSVAINWRLLMINSTLQTAEIKSLVGNRPELWAGFFEGEGGEEEKRMINIIKNTLSLGH